MKCFYHLDRDAVGICKSCQRALCPECAADIGKGIACAGRCEDDARQLVQLADSSIRQQPANDFIIARMRRNRIVTALFYLLVGGGFIVASIPYPHLRFISFLGGVFLVFGIYALTQLPKTSETSDHPLK